MNSFTIYYAIAANFLIQTLNFFLFSDPVVAIITLVVSVLILTVIAVKLFTQLLQLARLEGKIEAITEIQEQLMNRLK